MIDEVLACLRDQLSDDLAIAPSDVMVESAAVLARDDSPRGAYLALLNAKSDGTRRNDTLPASPTSPSVPRTLVLELQLEVLIACAFESYQASLMHLASTIRSLESRPLLEEAPTRVPNLDGPPRLTHEPLGVDAMLRVWSTLGTAYVPSTICTITVMWAVLPPPTPLPRPIVRS